MSPAGNTHGQVLIAKRAANKDQGNLWEFPGGKLERSESPLQALGRELKEEVGISITQSEFLTFTEHQYPNKLVQLWFYMVTDHAGTARGLENQEIRWVKIDQLNQYQVPAANQSVVQYLIDNKYRLNKSGQSV